MRNSLILVTIITSIALHAGLLIGGEYHTGATLICAECHIIGGGQLRDNAGVAQSSSIPITAIPLKDEPNALCLSCHYRSASAPVVLGENSNLGVRQAGTLNRVGGLPLYPEWTGHTLGSKAIAPGGTWSNPNGLKCIDCHHPHGEVGIGTRDVAGNLVISQYRNLHYRPGSATKNLGVSYALGANDITKDVLLRSFTLGQITTNYNVSNVDFNKPVSTNSGYAEWCRGCHTAFHGMPFTGTGPIAFIRHPTASVSIGALGGSHSNLNIFKTHLYRVKVMSPYADWGIQGTTWTATPLGLTPSCFSCHKAHGNKNPFGLIYLAGTGPLIEEGDPEGNNTNTGGVRHLCMQCHIQGSPIQEGVIDNIMKKSPFNPPSRPLR